MLRSRWTQRAVILPKHPVKKDILYSIATTPEGQLIKAPDAIRSQAYFCPVCNRAMVLRKGNQKRPHFAHKTLNDNCTAETALHHGFKMLLSQRIQEHIDQQTPLPIEWNCQFCRKQHSGNLLKKAYRVETEYNLGVCQPDLALLDSSDKVVSVIEVVVTHYPDKQAENYYKQHRIPVVLFVLQSDEDLSRLDAPVLKPDALDFCFNPRCSRCSRFMRDREIWIRRSTCWKCRNPMTVAAVDESDAYRGLTCNFSSGEIQSLKARGANIQRRYSKTMQDSYFVNVCTRCTAFVGNHYLYTQYFGGVGPDETIHTGYYCLPCIVAADLELSEE